MSNQTSASPEYSTPEQLIEKYGIKKAAYYERLKFLGIKAEKDGEGRAYLTDEQVELLDKLNDHINSTGKMEGFSGGGELALTSGSGGITTTASAIDASIPAVESNYENPNSTELDRLMREAAELKAQDLVMPDLIKLHLASQMTLDDLPSDLKAKVEAVRSAASPKKQPALVASSLLQQWRNNR